jgi:hypothetical protein
MTALALIDLNMGKELDSQALASISGQGAWHKTGSSISTGSWSGYSLRYKNYQGILFHDGYLSRKYTEGWKRTRTQTEYSSWNHYVKV